MKQSGCGIAEFLPIIFFVVHEKNSSCLSLLFKVDTCLDRVYMLKVVANTLLWGNIFC